MKAPTLAVGLFFSLFTTAWSCSVDSAKATAAASARTAPPSSPSAPAAPPPLRPAQRDLLQLAFDAASSFPLDPHTRNRSRAQDEVVAACFELGQPDLAES